MSNYVGETENNRFLFLKRTDWSRINFTFLVFVLGIKTVFCILLFFYNHVLLFFIFFMSTVISLYALVVNTFKALILYIVIITSILISIFLSLFNIIEVEYISNVFKEVFLSSVLYSVLPLFILELLVAIIYICLKRRKKGYIERRLKEFKVIIDGERNKEKEEKLLSLEIDLEKNELNTYNKTYKYYLTHYKNKKYICIEKKTDYSSEEEVSNEKRSKNRTYNEYTDYNAFSSNYATLKDAQSRKDGKAVLMEKNSRRRSPQSNSLSYNNVSEDLRFIHSGIKKYSKQNEKSNVKEKNSGKTNKAGGNITNVSQTESENSNTNDKSHKWKNEKDDIDNRSSMNSENKKKDDNERGITASTHQLPSNTHLLTNQVERVSSKSMSDSSKKTLTDVVEDAKESSKSDSLEYIKYSISLENYEEASHIIENFIEKSKEESYPNEDLIHETTKEDEQPNETKDVTHNKDKIYADNECKNTNDDSSREDEQLNSFDSSCLENPIDKTEEEDIQKDKECAAYLSNGTTSQLEEEFIKIITIPKDENQNEIYAECETEEKDAQKNGNIEDHHKEDFENNEEEQSKQRDGIMFKENNKETEQNNQADHYQIGKNEICNSADHILIQNMVNIEEEKKQEGLIDQSKTLMSENYDNFKNSQKFRDENFLNEDTSIIDAINQGDKETEKVLVSKDEEMHINMQLQAEEENKAEAGEKKERERSELQTEDPSEFPSCLPLEIPSNLPVELPSDLPVELSSDLPVELSSNFPVELPSDLPVESPSEFPVEPPSDLPVDLPSYFPAETPSDLLVEAPFNFLNSFPPSLQKEEKTKCDSNEDHQGSYSDIKLESKILELTQNFARSAIFNDLEDTTKLTSANCIVNTKEWIKLEKEDIEKLKQSVNVNSIEHIPIDDFYTKNKKERGANLFSYSIHSSNIPVFLNMEGNQKENINWTEQQDDILSTSDILNKIIFTNFEIKKDEYSTFFDEENTIRENINEDEKDVEWMNHQESEITNLGSKKMNSEIEFLPAKETSQTSEKDPSNVFKPAADLTYKWDDEKEKMINYKDSHVFVQLNNSNNIFNSNLYTIEHGNYSNYEDLMEDNSNIAQQFLNNGIHEEEEKKKGGTSITDNEGKIEKGGVNNEMDLGEADDEVPINIFAIPVDSHNIRHSNCDNGNQSELSSAFVSVKDEDFIKGSEGSSNCFTLLNGSNKNHNDVPHRSISTNSVSRKNKDTEKISHKDNMYDINTIHNSNNIDSINKHNIDGINNHNVDIINNHNIVDSIGNSNKSEPKENSIFKQRKYFFENLKKDKSLNIYPLKTLNSNEKNVLRKISDKSEIEMWNSNSSVNEYKKGNVSLVDKNASNSNLNNDDIKINSEHLLSKFSKLKKTKNLNDNYYIINDKMKNKDKEKQDKAVLGIGSNEESILSDELPSESVHDHVKNNKIEMEKKIYIEENINQENKKKNTQHFVIYDQSDVMSIKLGESTSAPNELINYEKKKQLDVLASNTTITVNNCTINSSVDIRINDNEKNVLNSNICLNKENFVNFVNPEKITHDLKNITSNNKLSLLSEVNNMSIFENSEEPNSMYMKKKFTELKKKTISSNNSPTDNTISDEIINSHLNTFTYVNSNGANNNMLSEDIPSKQINITEFPNSRDLLIPDNKEYLTDSVQLDEIKDNFFEINSCESNAMHKDDIDGANVESKAEGTMVEVTEEVEVVDEVAKEIEVVDEVAKEIEVVEEVEVTEEVEVVEEVEMIKEVPVAEVEVAVGVTKVDVVNVEEGAKSVAVAKIEEVVEVSREQAEMGTEGMELIPEFLEIHPQHGYKSEDGKTQNANDETETEEGSKSNGVSDEVAGRENFHLSDDPSIKNEHLKIEKDSCTGNINHNYKLPSNMFTNANDVDETYFLSDNSKRDNISSNIVIDMKENLKNEMYTNDDEYEQQYDQHDMKGDSVFLDISVKNENNLNEELITNAKIQEELVKKDNCESIEMQQTTQHENENKLTGKSNNSLDDQFICLEDKRNVMEEKIEDTNSSPTEKSLDNLSNLIEIPSVEISTSVCEQKEDIPLNEEYSGEEISKQDHMGTSETEKVEANKKPIVTKFSNEKSKNYRNKKKNNKKNKKR
ncbi:hypothetical protein, conserved [Plasmodium gonderi]|uniref:Uncharacterized protein n=1 Tax=Plasmodium gonderi TaxID=77519 RepID=A0A1Y1JDQ3_PLAGO|nr:hypothetical protein, conserved [Plasmodium gonderi]GAW78882.1 hypothetical protein, conserved [Plasmodium gonderi]